MGHVFRRYKVAFESVGGPDLVNIRFDPVDERGVGLFVQVDRATRLLFGNDEELTSAEILDRLDKAEGYSPAEEGLADLLRRREELFRLRWAEDEAWDELHWLASTATEYSKTAEELLAAVQRRMDREEAYRRFGDIHSEHMEAYSRFEKALSDYLARQPEDQG
jgi:hypothetical protein